ncbi:MAG TPA: metallopeptidase TldD-related protein, partial [Thermoanaerobaculia bacterium]|nr:metallopeptidase TldD-related protein [Thermoanaerobaculia bacterium]
PVRRRWLLREGVVAEPLADRRWAGAAHGFAAGAGRRAGRHFLPAPRSSHLELLPGEASHEALLAAAEGGLHLAAAESGLLDPFSGTFHLRFAHGRRIVGGEPAGAVGPCRLSGRVADLLAAVEAVGREARPAGAGWCAKGGQKMAVWATTPALVLADVEVTPDGADG